MTPYFTAPLMVSGKLKRSNCDAVPATLRETKTCQLALSSFLGANMIGRRFAMVDHDHRLPCARRPATFRSIIGRPLSLDSLGCRIEYWANQVVPLFGVFNPKQSILMLKLRTLTAESRHGTTIRNHIHIGPS